MRAVVTPSSHDVLKRIKREEEVSCMVHSSSKFFPFLRWGSLAIHPSTSGCQRVFVSNWEWGYKAYSIAGGQSPCLRCFLCHRWARTMPRAENADNIYMDLTLTLQGIVASLWAGLTSGAKDISSPELLRNIRLQLHTGKWLPPLWESRKQNADSHHICKRSQESGLPTPDFPPLLTATLCNMLSAPTLCLWVKKWQSTHQHGTAGLRLWEKVESENGAGH